MKYGYRIVILGLFLFPLLAGAQTFELSVQNQQVSGTEFTFDVYIKHLGGDAIRLGEADLILTFNDANFSSDTYAYVDKGDLSGLVYAFSASIGSTNRLILNISPGTIDGDKYPALEVISGSGNGTRLAKLKVTTISNPSGSAGLAWRTTDPNKTVIYKVNADYSQTNISANGTYLSPGDASLPVQLSRFEATVNTEGVLLEWATESELDNLGFILDRRLSTEEDWKTIADYKTQEALQGQGSTSEATEYAFMDRDVQPNLQYFYRLSDVSMESGSAKLNETYRLEVTTEGMMPKSVSLEPAYPNPFNPSTTFQVRLPDRRQVEMTVYDLSGRRVRTLLQGTLDAGIHAIAWDGRDLTGSIVSSGTYIVRLRAADAVRSQKVLFIR